MFSLQISASLLSADFLNLDNEIKRSVEAGVSSFHLDVMDGHLAPNISFGPPVIKHIRKATNLFLDAHLMIDQPWLYLTDYIDCKVDSILVHAEAYSTHPNEIEKIKTNPRKTNSINLEKLIEDLQFIKKHNIQAGITINPATPISVISPVLSLCDSVLIMSVNPGFSGQNFIPEALEKVQELRNIYPGEIKIDGGINQVTAKPAIQAGANTLITASYLYSSPDYTAAIKKLKST